MLLLLLSCQLPLLALIFSEAKLKHFLSLAELRRRDHRIQRCALVDANQSPWQKLYHSRNDQSCITFTGVDCGTFEYLLSKFRPMYQRYSPYSINGKIVRVVIQDGMPGRPRWLDAAACLGLVLGYTRTRGSLFSLQMIFGASHSVLSIVFALFYQAALQGIEGGAFCQSWHTIFWGDKRLSGSYFKPFPCIEQYMMCSGWVEDTHSKLWRWRDSKCILQWLASLPFHWMHFCLCTIWAYWRLHSQCTRILAWQYHHQKWWLVF